MIDLDVIAVSDRLFEVKVEVSGVTTAFLVNKEEAIELSSHLSSVVVELLEIGEW